ncbi:MAG: CDP-diacylglycerol--serine O-phosphatidyltransferase, partial [Telluria sp.]
AYLLMLLMVGVGSLMVSTIRFPSSKQPKNKWIWLAIALSLGLLAWLQTRFFALFFVFYVSATLLLNLAWRQGWRGIAAPVDERH